MPSVSSTTGLTQVNAGTIQDTSPPGPNFKGELGQTFYQKGSSNFYISNGSEWFLISIVPAGEPIINGNLQVTGDVIVGGDLSVQGESLLSGDVKISGPGSQLQINGGSVTDTLNTVTLTAGQVTVLNTEIAPDDRIIPFHIAPNASTALGILTYTISANTSFTISARNPTDATVQTGDVSTIGYLIVKQL